MSAKLKITVLILISAGAVILSIGVGSVSVSPSDVFSIIASKLTGAPLGDIPASYPSLILDIRIPRVFLSYVAGAALAMSGAVMQSLLQNPLASPFGLGVSSGAGLGAALITVTGASAALMPPISLIFAVLTVFAVIALAYKLDRYSNAALVLIGMVISLFCSSLMSLAGSYSPENAQRILTWQLGSFSMRDPAALCVLAPSTAGALILFMCFSREIDLMAFGERAAGTIGVNTARVKIILLSAVAALTGVAVSFVGIIGFVDLVVPYISRKFLGGAAARSLPACALIGGIFMTLCDLFARTAAQPREIPIGVITALLGAPFFIYVFFRAKRKYE